MKKEFINPALRVIKIESNSICAESIPGGVDPGSQNQSDLPAPTRAHIFGDSEF